MKSKIEPASVKIKKIAISVYSLNLFYMKGKDMTDFLFRIQVDKSNPHEIIFILFDLQDVLHEKYYIDTRSGAEKAGITVGKVHGYDKPLLPYMKPKKASEIISQIHNGTTMIHCS